MQRIMMKSKIHRATVTALDIDYEGSISIDEALLEAADILPGERVQVLNLNNGARFDTYAIRGKRNSGEMMLNGPCSRLAVRGDIIVVITYAPMEEAEARAYRPVVVRVDAKNRPVKLSRTSGKSHRIGRPS